MFYICTTAINRPDLHIKELVSFNKFFYGMGENFFEQVVWIINIDIISKLRYTYEETKKNYRDTIESLFPKSKIEFLEISVNPSFKLAVKKIAKNLSNRLKKGDKVLWLEDDWNYVGDITYKTIEKYLDDNTSFHMYWKCREDNLYPIIRGYEEAKIFINTIMLLEDNNDDPECQLMKYYPKIQKDYKIYIIKKNIVDNYVTGGMRSNIKRYLDFGSQIMDILILDEIDMNDNKMRHIAYNKILCKDMGKSYMMSYNLVKWNSGKSESNYSEIVGK